MRCYNLPDDFDYRTAIEDAKDMIERRKAQGYPEKYTIEEYYALQN